MVHLSVAWCVFVTSQSTSTVWVSASLSVFLSVQMIIYTSMHFTSVFFLLLLLVVLTSGLMLQEHFYGAQLLQERSERVRRLGVTQRRRVHTSLKVVESSPRVFLLDGISHCLTYFLLCTIVATADNSNCQQYFRLVCSFRNCMFC